MRGVLGWGCFPLCGGLPAARLSVGYLFIIYGVWELSRDTGGTGGSGGTVLVGRDMEDPAGGYASTSWHCSRPKQGCWQGHRGGRWLREGGRGWMGLVAPGPCACPLGGTQGCPGGVHLCR